MERRTFLAMVPGSLLAAPLAAEAQKAKVPRIGALSPWNSSLNAAAVREPFERGLRELGWTPGSTILIEQRYAAGKPEQLPTLAAELVQMKVDVIVAHGTQAIRAAHQATSKIPIVMSAAGDPIREGFVGNLARPGGNVTGLTVFAQGRMESKQLELLKEAIPGLTRIGILGNRSSSPADANEISVTARTLGLTVQTFEVSQPEDLKEVFAALARSGVGAVLVRPDPLVLDPHLSEVVVPLALKHRLPAIYPWAPVAARGGLMAYSTNLREIHRRSAFYVDRILRGARPGDLPIEQPTRFELVLNLKTAKALGLTIPQSLLLRADQVIE
jgi:ABC-type uncharacterized transport system substrate-binding protein